MKEGRDDQWKWGRKISGRGKRRSVKRVWMISRSGVERSVEEVIENRWKRGRQIGVRG